MLGAVGQVHDDRVVEPTIACLDDNFCRGEAEAALKAMGPMGSKVEDGVLLLLKDRANHYHAWTPVCHVLKEIGTAKEHSRIGRNQQGPIQQRCC